MIRQLMLIALVATLLATGPATGPVTLRAEEAEPRVVVPHPTLSFPPNQPYSEAERGRAQGYSDDIKAEIDRLRMRDTTESRRELRPGEAAAREHDLRRLEAERARIEQRLRLR